MVNTITLKNPSSAKRYLFMITWPIFIEVFLQILMKLTDVFMLSFVSDQAVAAIGVVNQLMTFMFVLFNFTAMGAGVVVAQYVGANDKDGVRKTIASAITINLLFGLAVSLFVGLNRHFLLGLFALEPELYAYASSYALIVGSALFAQAMILTVSSLLQAMGHTKDVMASVLIMNVLNVFGNYVLIFGALGFPRIGVTGVAISTATVRILIMVGMFVLLTKRMPVKMSLSSFFKLKKEYSAKILHIGVPSAGEQLSYNVSQLVLTIMITTLGATALATRVYSQNFMSVLVIFSLSIAKGMQIFIGQLVGAKKQDEAYAYMFMGFKFAGLVTIVIGSLFALFGRQIFSFFTDDPSLIALGSTIMIIELFLQPARTSNLVIISALRAAGDAKFPVLIGVTVMWGVLVPLAYLFGIVLGFGLPGIWMAMLIDEWIRGSLMYFRWKKKRWMNKRLVSVKI
ncbi:putative efflux protein, MATE family [Alkalibacterium subtropicum]|uniref:Putative efflux protein, MATE family n=1 Tax=Alkalibacterium subtropicum TaxID=753702 RepID=A0A1I1IT24_9LACT|nr:MATE family efflux transporter [Alkalibacterium subtropicum]SFC38882.1 putative efflux protein, MATE family [Alkalibacterium subtropicum]